MAPTIKKIVRTPSKENSRENSWRTQREFSLNKTNLISMYSSSVITRWPAKPINRPSNYFPNLIRKLKKT